jgi:hypothetical protein
MAGSSTITQVITLHRLECREPACLMHSVELQKVVCLDNQGHVVQKKFRWVVAKDKEPIMSSRLIATLNEVYICLNDLIRAECILKKAAEGPEYSEATSTY